MKKLKVLLSFLVIMLFVQSSALAANEIQVYVDGEKLKVREVPIIIDGQAIYSDPTAFIHKNSTYVPLRFVAEHYGSKVDWNQKTRSAIVEGNKKNIVMTINSGVVVLNNKSVKIDDGATPKLVTTKGSKNASTYVPLRFISEVLGYKVDYDKEKGVPTIDGNTSTKPSETKEGITSIDFVKGSTDLSKLNIKASKKMDIGHKKTGNKVELIVKNMGLSDRSISSKKLIADPIKGVTIKESGKNTIVTVDLMNGYDYDLVSFDGGKEYTLMPVAKIGSIKKETVAGKEAIVINKNVKTKVNKIKMDNPSRYVLDIMDSSTGYDYKDLKLKLGAINNVRVSQYTPSGSYNAKDRIARVVLDMNSAEGIAGLKIDESKDRIVITPEEDISELIDYIKSSSTGNLTIRLNKNTNYEFTSDSSAININLPSSSLSMNKGVKNINDGIVKNIEFKDSGATTNIRVALEKDIEVTDLNQGFGKDIKVKLESKNNNNNGNTNKPNPSGKKRIVLDAGHGGSDSGAVSNGVREKDIILPVTLKLEEILKNKGYDIVMTRRDDVFISLTDRYRIANDAGADVFVSIHANSFSGSSANGIETLHNNGESKELSQCIQTELIKATNATDRKIKYRPNLAVLRGTNMPATLVELGFITNPSEVNQLLSDSYQNILAEAIAKGVENYLNQ